MSMFAGRVALVTGAGQGIGRAYAEWLAAQGARVVVNNRHRPGTPAKAEAVAQAIRDAGGEAIADVHGVETTAGAQGMVRRALDHWGRLDVLVCNAAIAGSSCELQDMPLDELREHMDINFYGSVYPLAAALRVMAPAGYGRIVLTTSAAGLYGQPGMSIYGASKTALVGLARGVAIDNRGRDIRINLVSPYARTEMAKRIDPKFSGLLDPARIAPLVGWLCSEACDVSGRIYACGAGRLRQVSVVEGPRLELAGDVAELARSAADLREVFAPTSAANSSFSLAPELKAG